MPMTAMMLAVIQMARDTLRDNFIGGGGTDMPEYMDKLAGMANFHQTR